jgi:hypothetical protein
MSELVSPHQIEKLVNELNGKLKCTLSAADFSSKSFSKSSLADLLVQRYTDELTGEWTTEKAFAMLSNGLMNMGVSSGELRVDAKLDVLIPKENRRDSVRQWSRESGMELNVLKPNRVLNGILTLLFFVFIPLGIGMDWFFSGIGMAACAVGIFILNKTARNFRVETLGQLAESLAWNLYLQQQKKGANVSVEKIQDEVMSSIRNI